MVIGFGLDGSYRNLGIEVALVLQASVPGFGDGKFADEGNINLKVHQSRNPVFGAG